ncbi:uncharacterized protein LOC133910786 [Phragmites australis]|uniref:uncharacterized protein LOC133910786 n=1 Tax=Phragmites australis TaxID=29695 RepID=UPI002D785185|nr:uncharacterized protein LOC133910786 [Phragmites australis]
MEKAIKKAHMYRANQEGTAERMFSVLCRNKGQMGGRHMAHLSTPELLDPAVDKKHRIFLSAVHQMELAVFQPRGPGELLTIDGRWKQRGQGHLVSRTLVPYARWIVDVEPDDVPKLSKASAFAIGPPIVDQSSYPEEWYDELEEDRPTMGSLWCRRRVYKKGPAGWHLWVDRLAPYVSAWTYALEDIVEEPRPFIEPSFEEYLRWYVPRTRKQVNYTPDTVSGPAPLSLASSSSSPRRRIRNQPQLATGTRLALQSSPFLPRKNARRFIYRRRPPARPRISPSTACRHPSSFAPPAAFPESRRVSNPPVARLLRVLGLDTGRRAARSGDFDMATPLVAGLSVAAAALGSRYMFQAWQAFRTRAAMPRVRRFYPGGFQNEMTRREAALILGVRERAAMDKIKEAHKRVMVANHPDAGGSHYVALKINEAKDILMGKGKSGSSVF